MRILVLGATGRTGAQVLEQALGHGHDVTAFVRDPARLTAVHDRLQVVVGDVSDPAAVQDAVDGHDAVISALGSRGERPVTVYSDGIANTIRAMTARGIHRLVVCSAGGAGGARNELPLTMRLFTASPGMKAIYDDLDRMEGDIMLSDLEWTIVRPAGLTDGPLTGRYRTVLGSVVPKGQRISRADVAALMLKCAEGDLYSRAAVAIAY
ncbi:MAG: SDR family oxidoreductase [Coriobacteriia bacterium]|nr:SDR family oxidoreductase [Coriobacteriia bacterium]